MYQLRQLGRAIIYVGLPKNLLAKEGVVKILLFYVGRQF